MGTSLTWYAILFINLSETNKITMAGVDVEVGLLQE